MARRIPRPSAATLRRALALVAALTLALPLPAALGSASPGLLRMVALGLLALGALRPAWGLLVVAGLGAVATPVAFMLGAPFGGPQMIEALAIPYLVGFLARVIVVRDDTPAAPIVMPAAMLGLLVLVAGVVQLIGLQRTTAWPDAFYPALVGHVTHDYFLDPSSFAPVHATLVWMEALGLAVAAATLAARSKDARRGLVTVLLAGAAAAAALSVIRLVEISARTATPWASALNFLLTTRVSPQVADLNAAGSFFALFAVAACWLAVHRRSVVAAITAPLLIVALWMTGSRAALAAAVLGLGSAWLVTRRLRTSVLALALVGVLVVAWAATANPGRKGAATRQALLIRADMAQIGLTLATEQPVFGLGLGQFRPASARILTPEMVARFPAAATGENAHNNFLQILVELGLAGLAAFLWMLGSAFGPVWRSVRARDTEATMMALAAGMLAFLLTCLAGHPLLTPQVQLPVFLALGTLAGHVVGSEKRTTSTSSSRLVPGMVLAAVLIGLVATLASVPSRVMDHVTSATSDGATIGVSPAVGELDGVRYRLVERRARFWLPAETRVVEVPLRVGDATEACTVSLAFDGQPANAVTLTAETWQTVRLSLGGVTGRRARQLDLTVQPTTCHVLVGPVARRD